MHRNMILDCMVSDETPSEGLCKMRNGENK